MHQNCHGFSPRWILMWPILTHPTNPSTHPPTHSLTHPPTHSLDHSLTPSLTHSLTHSLTQKIKRFLFMCTCVVPSVNIQKVSNKTLPLVILKMQWSHFQWSCEIIEAFLFQFYFHILDLFYSMWPGQNHGQYQGSRWPGDTRTQGFSSNGI